MMVIEMTVRELLANAVKRLLLLAGKLAGYKGFAVLVATVLLCRGFIGEAAWTSVIISALCGIVVPKTFSNMGVNQNENEPFKNISRVSRTVVKPSDSGRIAVSKGKTRIRKAVESARRMSDCGTGEDS